MAPFGHPIPHVKRHAGDGVAVIVSPDGSTCGDHVAVADGSDLLHSVSIGEAVKCGEHLVEQLDRLMRTQTLRQSREADDIGEQNDLAKKMPEKTAEMLAVLHNWRKDIDAHTRGQNWGKK